MIRRPPRSTRVRSSAASDVYKRQALQQSRGSGQRNTRRVPFKTCPAGDLLTVVVPACGHADLVFTDLVDESVFLCNSARPVAVKTMLERLGLTDPLVAVAINILDQRIDPLQYFPVLGLPPHVVTPSTLVPHEFHSARTRSIPPPFSSRSIDAISRRTFSGLLSK